MAIFCFSPNCSHYKEKGVTYTHEGVPVKCIFCRILRKELPGRIVLEEEHVVAFKTRSPVSPLHLLISPREHVRNLRDLSGKEDAQLIKQLVEAGKRAVGEELAEKTLFCFHVPPFNSIDHLHLHAIAEPDKMSIYGKIKYTLGTMWCKSANQLIMELENSPQKERAKIFL